MIFAGWSMTASAQQIFAPGQVDEKHGEHAKKCSDCHDAFNGLPDIKCLKCHKKISNERKIAQTIHGRTEAPCASCHEVHGRKDSRPESALSIHDGSEACAKCHAEPADHYFGSNCGDCHTTDTWQGTTFNHPRVRGHSPASMACSLCHPNGYSSSSCSGQGCHRQAGGYGNFFRERDGRRFNRW